MSHRDRCAAALARVTFRGALGLCRPLWEVQDPPRPGRPGTALLRLWVPDSRASGRPFEVVVPVRVSVEGVSMPDLLRALADRAVHELTECVLEEGVATVDPHTAPDAYRRVRSAVAHQVSQGDSGARSAPGPTSESSTRPLAPLGAVLP